MSKPMPRIAGLVAKATPEAIEDAKKLPKLSGTIEGLVMRSAEPAVPDMSGSEQTMTLPIDLVVDSPYQNRQIDETHTADLAEIIQADGLNQPITVRPIQNGRFEIIAGHHRLAAFKLLEKDAIPVVIKNVDEVGAARSLLFDNIHHKTYTDYEVFKGFQTLKNLDKTTTIRSLAKDTGWSKSSIQRIFSYGRLPEGAIRLLEENQSLIGGKAAEDLAALCEAGHEQHVVEALEHIKDGLLTEYRAASWVKSRIAPKGRPVSREVLRDGKTYCSISRERNVLRINVAKNIDPEEIENAVCEFLEKTAEKERE